MEPEVTFLPNQMAEKPTRQPTNQPERLTTPSAAQEPEQAPVSPPPTTEAEKVKVALKVVTVYLEQEDDDFLEDITHTGRTTQPKTAISRSAVVRLALERLHTQLSPDEIVRELRPRGSQQGTGRKRR